MIAGFVLATGSGLFAANKISTNTGTPQVTMILPSGDLMTWKKGIGEFRITRRDLDPLTTGSIPAAGEEAARAVRGDAAVRGAAEARILTAYTLIDVSNGTARVESADGLCQVRPGSVLPGAGRVNSIERSEGEWMVVTTNGVIRDIR